MDDTDCQDEQGYFGSPAWSDESYFEAICYPACERIVSVYWDESRLIEAYFAVRYSLVPQSVRESRGDFFRVQLKEIGRVIDGRGGRLFLPAGREAQYRNKSNTVQVIVDTKLGQAKFGPIGNILIEGDLRGHRLGRFLLTEVITWLKENYPAFAIAKGSLLFGDATEDNIERRDQFYKGAGLLVDYTREKSDGHFSIDRIEKLTPYCPVNMRLISPESLAERALLAEERNNKCQDQNRLAHASLDEYRHLLGRCLILRNRFAGALVFVLCLLGCFALRNWPGFKNWIVGLVQGI